MAEIVGKHEDNIGREIEEMINMEVFSRQEGETIIKKRKALEYKRRKNTLENHKEYIEFELSLYRVIKVRRKSQKHLEAKARHRVKIAYERALENFPKDTELYFSFFKFCKESSHNSSAKIVTASMLKNNADNEEVWLVSARWHVHDRKNYLYAIQLLLQGIAKLGKSHALYKELLQYEVAHATSSVEVEADESTSDFGECNERLEGHLKDMSSTITEPQFYIDILTWLEEDTFTKHFQQNVIDFLVEKMADHYVVWDYLAQRERRGLRIKKCENLSLTPGIEIINCIQKYEEGLKKVSTENKQALWNFYLDCLCEIKTDEFLVANLDKKKVLVEVYAKAAGNDALLEKYYLSWMESVDEVEAYNVLLLGILKYPHSMALWELRLRHVIQHDNRTNILNIFNTAIEALTDEALPLWILIERYHILSSSMGTIEAFYKSAISQGPKISNEFKPKYLKWIALNKTMDNCREVYFELVHMQPFCKSMYSMMNTLESSQLVPAYEPWEKMHQVACEQFGQDDIEVWLNYVIFYFYYKRNKSESNDKALQIQEMARGALPEYLFLDFEEKFKLMLREFQNYVLI